MTDPRTARYTAPLEGVDVMPPPDGVATANPSGADDRLRAAVVAALDEVEALAASAPLLADLPDAERAAVMAISDDLLLGAPDAAADVEVTPSGDGAALATLPGADWLIPYTDDGVSIQIADPSAWLRQTDEVTMVEKCDPAAPPSTAAPGYAAARDPRASCGTCQAFRVAGGDTFGQGAYGECLWFSVPVDAAFTCDEWAPAVGLFSGPAVENAAREFDKAKEREYQRAEDGKFGTGPGSGGDKKEEAPKKEPAKEEAPEEPPAVDPAAQEAAAVAAGLDPRDAATLASPEAIAALPVEEAERLSAAGLLVRNEDGSYAPSELGAAVSEQVAAGDAEAAAESVERAAEEHAAEQAGETPPPSDSAAEAEAPAGGAEQKPAGGGGGGGGEPFRPPSQEQMMETISSIPQAERDANREKIGEKLKLPPGFVAAVDEVKDPSEGIKMNPEASAQAQQMGLVRVNDAGVEELTDAGRLFVTAAAAGDAKSAELAVDQGSKEAPATKAAIRKRGAGLVAPSSVHWSFAFAKVDGEQRIVEGYASSEALDSQPGVWKGQTYEGDVVDAASINAALPDYLQYANIREMHQPSAVGVALKAEVIPGEVTVTLNGRRRTLRNPLYLVVKVVDDAAWAKVKAGVYKGFSIGGAVVDAAVQRMGGRLVRLIKALQLTEISLVDRPANPDARIVVWKLAAGPTPTGGSMPVTPSTIPIDQEALARAVKDALSSMATPLAPLAGEIILKAAEPSKVISAIQALRNDAELAGDVEAAQMYTQAITLVMQASGDAEGAEVEAEAEIEVETPEGDATTEITQGARATTLRKAGRVMARKRMDMMRPVVKSLLTLMADSGDEQAARALKAYGPGEDATTDALAGEDAGAAIGKALGVELATGLRPLAETVAKIQQDQAALADALDAISRIARPGGPAARPVPVPKALATEPQREAVATEDVSELQRLASTEPDPKLRAYYQQRLYKATTHRP